MGRVERRDSRRNGWLALGVSLVLVILFVAGILLSQSGTQPPARVLTPVTAPTTTATAALPTGFIRVTDANRLYSFAVPLNWIRVPPPHTVPHAELTIYTDPAHDTTFEVESFPTTTQQGGAALDKLVLLQNFPELAPSDLSQPVSASLAGETWIKETAQINLTQSGATTTYNLVVQTTTDNGTTLIIFYDSPDTASGTGSGEALLKVLQTFTLLG